MPGAILDVDATVVSSNAGRARAWVDVAVERRVTIAPERVHGLLATGAYELLPPLFGLAPGDPEAERIAQRQAEIFRRAYVPQLRPTRGVKALVERLAAERIELAVTSLSWSDELQAILALARVPGLAERAIAARSLDRSTAGPERIRAALARLGTKARETVMIGDTPHVIEAASKAGLGTIALRSGGLSDDDLSGALAIYDDLADLVVAWDESPLGEGRPPPSAAPRRTTTTTKIRRGAGGVR